MGLGAAGVLGATSLAGAGIQALGAQSAAKQQQQGTQQAIQAQLAMFGQAQGALSPYYTAGQGVLPTLQSLLTPGTAASTLSQLPGFQFQSQWGTKQAQNTLAAEGLGGSTGPLAKAVSDYNNGLAGTYYGNYVQGAQNFANMGTGAAAALAGNSTAVGQGIGQSATAGGNALASGTLGTTNALAGGVSGLGNAYLLNSVLGSNSANNSGIFGNITDQQLAAAGGI
jgi:hypothetical protein